MMSGEWMEPMEKVPLRELGKSELERLVLRVDGEKPGVDSSAEG